MNLALIAVFFTAAALTALLMPSIIKVASEKRLFDEPDHRKKHSEVVSSLGGVGMFCGFWLSLFLFSDFITPAYFKVLFVATFILLLVGVFDDLIVMNSYKKLGYQILAANLLWFGGLKADFITFIGFPESEILVWGATVFLVILIINAYNLIDGLNGLAGSQGLIALTGFTLIFLLNNNPELTVTALAAGGVFVAFLFFNFGRASIFMGDNGSMFLGLLLSLLFIEGMNAAYSASAPSYLTPLVPVSLVFLPVVDLVRVAIIRMLQGHSPFRPDRSHIHHLLRDLRRSHTEVSLTLVGLKISLILFAILLGQKNELFSGILFMVLPVGIVVVYSYLSRSLTELKESEEKRRMVYYIE